MVPLRVAPESMSATTEDSTVAGDSKGKGGALSGAVGVARKATYRSNVSLIEDVLLFGGSRGPSGEIKFGVTHTEEEHWQQGYDDEMRMESCGRSGGEVSREREGVADYAEQVIDNTPKGALEILILEGDQPLERYRGSSLLDSAQRLN
ncbi:hypothetical protein B296_00053700 [Ensete ventricosum]|uniref:Uncharacterized protein n=1 Tax=Ensete ventricosum TaxID=4639 RepID=A0A426XA53_ENSVE|nr:hypothetical protein B296_00053700 [Ensete ventricosum]